MADTINVSVVSEKKYAYDTKLILASLRAIDHYEPNLISISIADASTYQSNKKTDWIFLLSDGNVTTTDEQIIRLEVHPSENIIEQQSQSTWIITKRLTPENVVDENLTAQLTRLLFPETKSWAEANELDIRASDDRLIKTNTTLSEKTEATIYSGEGLWVFFIALTFITERIVAYKRMQ
jgi:hypothetical protein